MTEELISDRLLLRLWRIDDAETLYELARAEASAGGGPPIGVPSAVFAPLPL